MLIAFTIGLVAGILGSIAVEHRASLVPIVKQLAADAKFVIDDTRRWFRERSGK